ncbi:MAG: YtxH domain-containing protein [Erysipelotrichales bacterium]|nr:YtxH domain-containing protein [Erysipelotrichales bacterium]
MKLGKFIMGLGIGAVAGLLLAPKKGSELREDIKNETLKAYDNVKSLTKEDVEAMLGQTIESVKKTVDEFDIDVFKQTTKEKLTELQEKLEEFAGKIKKTDQYEMIKDTVVEISDKVKEKILDTQVTDYDIDDLEDEINNVEEKLEEMIEEIKE